jgi:hypothetical protein
MDAELVCDYKRVAVLRHGGAQKTAESLPKKARGHGVTLDVNVFAKLEGRGLGQPWRLWWLTVVTRKLATVMVLGWDSTMARVAFGGALSLGTFYGGGRSQGSSSRRGIDMGGTRAQARARGRGLVFVPKRGHQWKVLKGKVSNVTRKDFATDSNTRGSLLHWFLVVFW